MRDLDEWTKRNLLINKELDEADPIWGQPARVYNSVQGGWVVLSDRSGTYMCAPGLRESIQHWSPEKKANLTSWINEQNRLGEPFPKLLPQALEEAWSAKPKRFREKVDQFFRYLQSIGYRPGDYILPSQVENSTDNHPAEHAIMRWTEAATERELRGLFSTLVSEGLMENQHGLRLTGRGLSRMDDLDATGAETDQVFVAMWFGDEMSEVYEKGIVPALAEVGYKAFRIDQKEHANKIDDEIIAEIRRSRFVVADFTCGTVPGEGGAVGVPRGGVYYEAGFAQGLGMPVIWTVRQDQIGLVHFDTRQFNHIAWTDADDLRVRLSRRVAAVVGERRAR
ncbi:hypothetical protein SAMN05192583_0087 [Sphingomonas gellani]|uniref:Nucleoside 2-deoxyribosyltransferase n=1 Tax=Sphingomonas gellani TaxID=1166340 RepID=A0A1H7Y4M9_9SPHN|nr:hypothetical protein [Sphingomonas gellani]SEM40901.1 hypothetical protein SAMN05192583_0087 [Sphingomonas gellani]